MAGSVEPWPQLRVPKGPSVRSGGLPLRPVLLSAVVVQTLKPHLSTFCVLLASSAWLLDRLCRASECWDDPIPCS